MANRVLATLLLVTAVFAFGYALGLLLVPDLLRDLSAAPSERVWVLYGVPVCVGLGTIGLAAARDPVPSKGVVWGITVVWAGLFIVLVNGLLTGNEPWTWLTWFRLVFGPGMPVGLAGAQLLRVD